jgi:pSer/pThr/pTyr-binding forkhead associated (FHA) protein
LILAKASNSTAVKTVLPSFPDAMLRPKGRYSHLVPVGIGRPLTIIGAGDHVHIRLRSRTISPAHAMLLNVDGKILIRDLCSDFRVTVNRREVRQAVLKDGDVIRIGRIRFALSLGPRAEEPLESEPLDARIWNQAGEAVPISTATFVMGSSRDADLVLPEPMPAAHVAIFVIGRHRFIRNLCPASPLLLNDAEIQQAVLVAGDMIDIQGHRFQYDASPVQRPVEHALVAAAAKLGMPVATDVPLSVPHASGAEAEAPVACAVAADEDTEELSDPFADLNPESNEQDDQPTMQRELQEPEESHPESDGLEPAEPGEQSQVAEEEREDVEAGDEEDLMADLASEAPDCSCDAPLLNNMRALGPLAVALLVQHGAALPPAPVAEVQEPPRKSNLWQRIAVALVIAGVIGAGLWWGLAHRPLL